jgi:hypothetical protein
MPDELYRRRKTFAFRPGQAVDVPLKGTIDFPSGRGPLDVLQVLIRAPYQTRHRTDQDTRFSPIGGLKESATKSFGHNRRNKKPSNL